MVEKQGRDRRGGIVIDVSLALLATALMMRQHFPAMLHQICGVLFGILIAIHICQHRAWIASLKQGKPEGKRLVGAFLMAAILACTFIMVASGLAMSTWASALGVPAGTGTARALHLPLSHLCYCLMGMHAGLHAKGVGKLPRPAVTVWSLLAAMGIWSFAALDFGSYIMGTVGFALIDHSKPALLDFAQYISVFALFMLVGAALQQIHLERGRNSSKR